MSKFYKEKNNESTARLFNKRVIYLTTAENSESDNLIDFSAEKYLYGRVNRVFTPINIPQNSTRLKSIPSKSVTSSNFRALNFVVDAFFDLQKQFDKCLSIGKIDSSDEYLSSLKVYKAYLDPFDRYTNYTSTLSRTLKSDSAMQATDLPDFKMFSDRLLRNMKNIGKTNPLSFPAFIKSRKNPINISGLAIEIANIDASNDEEKNNRFLKSKNWDFYINTCRSYGFMVDKDVPWRIVADIGSKEMLKYSSRYGFTTTNSIISAYYENSSFNYYNTFTQNMLDLYNNIKPRSIIKLTECNGKTITNRTKPKEYTNTEILQNSYGQDNFLMLYCKLRFTEEESQYTEEEKRSIIRETLQISKSKSGYYAIKNFESLINKTFDYQGSLGYYVRGQREREQQEIFGETTISRY